MKKLTHRIWAKTMAFILLLILALVAVLAAIGGTVMTETEVYTVSEAAFRREAMQDLAARDGNRILGKRLFGDRSDLLSGLDGTNIVGAEIRGWNSDVNWFYDRGHDALRVTEFPMVFVQRHEGSWPELFTHGTVTPEIQEIFAKKSVYQVTLTVAADPAPVDEYFYADWLITAAYALRFWIWPILAVSVILAVLLFVFLLAASGRKAGSEEPVPGWGTWMPTDLLAVLLGSALLLLGSAASEAAAFSMTPSRWLVLFACGEAALALFTGFCMSLSLRRKLGTLWKNTVIARLLRGMACLVRKLPLIWKTAVCVFLVSFLELLVLSASAGEQEVLFFFWLAEKLLLIPAVLYIAVMLRTLRQAGQSLAEGDLSHQVETRKLFLEFREHGEDLNRMNRGIALAVEDRLRSERMKTELITNVSHDLKTPLTSVINYADLICREQTDNENVNEYARVLHRQADRLRHLVDDLVEASKAATGNLDVLLAPVDLSTVLSQTEGEYADRLRERELTLVTRRPDSPVTVHADGRRLGRVLDNLMVNVLKYAMPGTRVYLTLESVSGTARLTLRNTSREPLELSAEEFTERFVRGDQARSGEGSGLGLSIAKSLTELQGGRFLLTVDGDLFKVTLEYPVT